jgi:alanyl-tRNA synthetase
VEHSKQLSQAARLLNVPMQQVEKQILKLLQERKEQEKQMNEIREQLSRTSVASQKVSVRYQGIPTYIYPLPGQEHEVKALRELATEQGKENPDSIHIALGGNKIVIAVPEKLQTRVMAMKLLSEIVKETGGVGGGKKDVAQGQINATKDPLQVLKNWSGFDK